MILKQLRKSIWRHLLPFFWTRYLSFLLNWFFSFCFLVFFWSSLGLPFLFFSFVLFSLDSSCLLFPSCFFSSCFLSFFSCSVLLFDLLLCSTLAGTRTWDLEWEEIMHWPLYQLSYSDLPTWEGYGYQPYSNWKWFW